MQNFPTRAGVVVSSSELKVIYNYFHDIEKGTAEGEVEYYGLKISRTGYDEIRLVKGNNLLLISRISAIATKQIIPGFVMIMQGVKNTAETEIMVQKLMKV